jgi:hypothetical protein
MSSLWSGADFMTSHMSRAAYFGKPLSSTAASTISSKAPTEKTHGTSGFTHALSEVENSSATTDTKVKTGFANGSALITSEGNDAVVYSQRVKSAVSSKKV